jgi:tetratricopeptide (TPR) repeat protein
LETLGRTAEAETAYRRALALRPDHADANYRLAALFRARGEDETAARYYRQPLQTEPGHLRALDELGDVLLDDGQLDAAREAYDRAEEVSPSYGRRI